MTDWPFRDVLTVPFARQQSQDNVRFGSKADIDACPSNVRFTPNSGHGTQPRNVCFVPKADIAFTLNWRQVGILFYGGTTRFEACFSGIATT